jgi:signal transduction histidine kinase
MGGLLIRGIRGRVLAAIVLPAVLVLLLSSVWVHQQVRSDRMADLDARLAGWAQALAALVERDGGRWETEFDGEAPPVDLTGGLQAWRVRTVDGRVLAHGGPDLADQPLGASRWANDEVRHWAAIHRVTSDDDPPGAPPAEVRVDVAADLGPLEADLRSMARTSLLVGLVLGLLAALAGLWLARAIARPIEELTHRAERIHRPTPDPDLPTDAGLEEIDRLSSTLRAAFRRLHDLWAQKARFTADASHELRTPLAVIRTEAEVALRRPRAPDDYRASLATVLEGATRMQETLEGLLLLARADAGDPLRTEPVELGALARAVARAHAVIANVEDVTVKGDAALLRTLLDNLVRNAVRHASRDTVEVGITHGPDQVRITVVDAGEGIAPEHLPHVRERFYRADASRTRGEADGAGLGLAIVQGVAEVHGGSVNIRSTPGEGTTVEVWLPGG